LLTADSALATNDFARRLHVTSAVVVVTQLTVIAVAGGFGPDRPAETLSIAAWVSAAAASVGAGPAAIRGPTLLNVEVAGWLVDHFAGWSFGGLVCMQ
jgi:hypothetical protein